MKIKGSKIAMIAIVVIVLALGYLYLSNKGKSEPGRGKVIVTPMPVTGYSIEDAAMDNGFPEALPESLENPEIDAALNNMDMRPGDDVIGSLNQTLPVEDTTSPAPITTEEFATYAPKNWRGNVL
jgi:hypothetical protein